MVDVNTVFVAIDAIDETQDRADLLQVLQTLATKPEFEKMRIVASGREYSDIERIMTSIAQCISMDNAFVANDIRKRVQTLLFSNPQFQKWPTELLFEAQESLCTRAGGM